MIKFIVLCPDFQFLNTFKKNLLGVGGEKGEGGNLLSTFNFQSNAFHCVTLFKPL